MPRRYAVLDVFADRPLAGNPLAVVFDAEGLDTTAMQAIAREFNLSETVFVLPPQDERHRARLRIFTPGRELPFAGHPTVGTAIALALEDGDGGVDARAFGLEEEVGIVPCVVELTGERQGRARFRLPKLPLPFGERDPDAAECAMALGLEPGEIGFGRHLPSRHSAGVPYDLVPVRSREALDRARATDRFDAVFGENPAVYLYTPETADPNASFQTRMLSGLLGAGIHEDPATGSAAAAFAGALMQFEPMGEGVHDVLIEQGFAMGRPSRIALQLQIEQGALAGAEIGGDAVVVARGELFA